MIRVESKDDKILEAPGLGMLKKPNDKPSAQIPFNSNRLYIRKSITRKVAGHPKG